MKRIEDLLKEVKIRFGENWEDAEIDIISYPFDEISFCIGGNSPAISHDEVWSNNGLLYRVEIDGKEKWSTAKITKKTEKWVVEKDENHPVWERFREWMGEAPSYEDCDYVGQSNFGQNTFADNIFYFEGYQYLTLDQWAEFYLPKVDFSIHNDCEFFFVKTRNYRSWLSRGKLTEGNCACFNLRNKILDTKGHLVNSKNDIIEFRRPTDEEMNVLYEKHPEYAPPKEGDWGVFWDDHTPAKKVDRFYRITQRGRYLDDLRNSWQHFKPFSPELQEMIKKEIDNI